MGRLTTIDRKALRKVSLLVSAETAAGLDRMLQTEGQCILAPCSVGSTVYWVLHDTDGWKIVPDRVTEIGSKGFFVSDDGPGGIDSFICYDAIGTEVFLSFEAAEAARKERMQYGKQAVAAGGHASDRSDRQKSGVAYPERRSGQYGPDGGQAGAGEDDLPPPAESRLEGALPQPVREV